MNGLTKMSLPTLMTLPWDVTLSNRVQRKQYAIKGFISNTKADNKTDGDVIFLFACFKYLASRVLCLDQPSATSSQMKISGHRRRSKRLTLPLVM